VVDNEKLEKKIAGRKQEIERINGEIHSLEDSYKKKYKNLPPGEREEEISRDIDDLKRNIKAIEEVLPVNEKKNKLSVEEIDRLEGLNLKELKSEKEKLKKWYDLNEQRKNATEDLKRLNSKLKIERSRTRGGGYKMILPPESPIVMDFDTGEIFERENIKKGDTLYHWQFGPLKVIETVDGTSDWYINVEAKNPDRIVDVADPERNAVIHSFPKLIAPQYLSASHRTIDGIAALKHPDVI
jgi:hypothetical protein